MNDQDASARFSALLRDQLRQYDADLPSIPDSPGRRAYLNFLKTMGYKENELLPIIERGRLNGMHHGAVLTALLGAVQEADAQKIKYASWLAHNVAGDGDNTNLLIWGIAQNLRNKLSAFGVNTPNFYAGVFPTDSYNAQCRLTDGEALVLIDTGCMEMTEAVTNVLLSKVSIAQRTSEISEVLHSYVASGVRANPYTVTTYGIQANDPVPTWLLTAAEEFILLHEIGHLALGHISDTPTRQLEPGVAHPVAVASKSEAQEFQADAWALTTMLGQSQDVLDPDEAATATASPLIVFGLALLVEGFHLQIENSPLRDGHPPAAERLYLLQTMYDAFDVHPDQALASNFMNVIQEAIEVNALRVDYPRRSDAGLDSKIISAIESIA